MKIKKQGYSKDEFARRDKEIYKGRVLRGHSSQEATAYTQVLTIRFLPSTVYAKVTAAP